MAGAGESDTDESISLSRHIRFLVQRDLNEARLESKKKLQKYEKNEYSRQHTVMKIFKRKEN